MTQNITEAEARAQLDALGHRTRENGAAVDAASAAWRASVTPEDVQAAYRAMTPAQQLWADTIGKLSLVRQLHYTRTHWAWSVEYTPAQHLESALVNLLLAYRAIPAGNYGLRD